MEGKGLTGVRGGRRGNGGRGEGEGLAGLPSTQIQGGAHGDPHLIHPFSPFSPAATPHCVPESALPPFLYSSLRQNPPLFLHT